MAQKAKKDRAKANTAALNNLHIGTLTMNGLFIIYNILIRRRALLPYIILSIPCLIAEFVLESTGRPKHDPVTKALKSSGEDLAAEGLTEYMFDVVWITWGCLVAVVAFGNWGWIIWSLLPMYGAYKLFGLWGMTKGMRGGNAPPVVEEQAPAGNRRQRRAA